MQTPPLRLARARLRRLARDGRDAASLDADRRQGPARADALAQPRLARAALRRRARPRHVGDPRRRRSPRDRVRLRRPPPRRAHVERAGARLRAGADVGGRLPRRVLAELAAARIEVAIHPAPNEVDDPIPFADDTVHAAYDARRGARVLARAGPGRPRAAPFRTSFLGKASPVHFFWGSFDLAVTRFSGRAAPLHPGGIPDLPDAVTREAYSHEVSSAGFWPGNDAFPQAAFYSYAYPSPPGFADARVEPEGARWSKELGEWLLPYELVRDRRRPRRRRARLPRIDLSRRRRPGALGSRRSTARSAWHGGRGRSAERTRHRRVSAGSARRRSPCAGSCRNGQSRAAAAPATSRR